MAVTEKDDNVRTDSSPKDTVFHYSRERRLSRASPAVQAMNEGSYVRPTLRKVLFGTRGNIIMFASIIVISVFGLAIHYITRESSPATTMTFGGNHLSLAILRVEEALILGIIKDAPERGEFFTGEVEIAVSPAVAGSNVGEAEEESLVFNHRVLFRPVTSETFHISLPFEGDDFFAILRAGDEQRSIRLRVVETD
jgi:hypothetical protein